MVALAEAFVRVRADTGGVRKSIEGDFGKAGTGAGKSFSGAFGTHVKGAVKGIAGTVAGLFAVDKIAGFFTESIAGARESAKVQALTQQVIKSTGGAANLSAQQVGNLATKVSNLTGVDDENIQSGENLLLTFKNIQNQAGRGNDIFTQTTKIMTDMSVALGQDTKASAIQLGKALNDPVKGVTALQRVGVSFTAQQRKQIKALVDSGNTLGAQKIILKELKSEFGGAAAAAATPAQKLQVAWGNFQEQVGGQLIPLIDRFAEFMTGRAIPALSNMVNWVSANSGTVKAWAVGLGVAAGVIGTIAGVIKVVQFATTAWAAAQKVAAAATRIWAAGQWLLNVALNANPIGLIVVAVAALVAAFIVAYKKSATFRAIVQAALHGVQAAAAAVGAWFTGPFVGFFTGAWAAIRGAAMAVAGFFTATLPGFFVAAGHAIAAPFLWLWHTVMIPVWNGIKIAMQPAIIAFNVVKILFLASAKAMGIAARALWHAVFAPVGHGITAALRSVGAAASWLWHTAVAPALRGIAAVASWLWHAVFVPIGRGITAAIRGVGTAARWLWHTAITPAFAGIRAVVAAAWSFLRGHVFVPIHNFIYGPFAGAFRWLWHNLISPVWNGIRSAISSVWSFIHGHVFNPMTSMVNHTIPNAFRSAASLIGRYWGKVKELAKAPVNFLIYTVYDKGIRGIVGKIASWVGEKNPLPYVKMLAAGGPMDAAQVGWTNRPTAVVGEGSRRYPEVVIPTDPRYRGRALGLYEQLGGRLMAGGGVLDWITHPVRSFNNAVAGPLAGLRRLGSNPWVRLLAAIPGKLAGSIVDKAKSMLSTLGGMFGGGSVVRATGPVVDIVRRTAAQFGWGSGAQWAALSWIISHESGWRPTAQNPTSSAYGLFQFLDGTWATVGGHKTSNPALQSLYGMRYMKKYGDPLGAKAFWQAHGWYQNGAWNVPRTGPAMIHKGEMVFPRDVADAIRTGGLVPNVRVFIGDRELTDIVDVRVDHRNEQAARRAALGRRR